MPSGTTFAGFPKECLTFFRQLSKNNNKKWFDANKDRYKEAVVEPARQFVVAVGQRLVKIAPSIHAEPKTNRSIFRINRDIRFSKDKRPYKEHLALWFWEGHGPRMECSGFYFHLEPSKLMLGSGMYMFPKPVMQRYRDAVVDPKIGAELRRAIRQVEKKGLEIGRTQYKKVPRGYDPEHKNAEWLKFGGLTAHTEMKIPPEFHSPKIVDYTFARFKDMLPMHRWLSKIL
jgi:uncharacterized protein (TIGR02453 family)